MSEILNSILNDVRSSRNFQDNLIMLCQDDLGHQRWPPSTKTPVRNLHRPPSMTLRMAGPWHSLNHARELKFGRQLKNHISLWSMMSRMTPSSKTPVRNLQHPPSITLRMAGPWQTSNHARELKFGTLLKNHISWWSMMSRMTPSSKTPVRNL